jgi:hypothetical protein
MHVRSRFADLPTWAARLLLVLLLSLSFFGAAMTVDRAGKAETAAVDLSDTDLALYEAIVSRVGAGQDYYSAAVAEQRARDYPLRPAFTVRLPTLAWTLGALGEERGALVLRLLMIVAVAALAFKLRSSSGSRIEWGAAAFLGAASMALLTVPAMTFWHESWAALLIALSIALHSPGGWLPSLLLGLLAALFRELALPFLCVMSVLAWRDVNRLEAASWAAAIFVVILAMVGHHLALAEHLTSADPASPGWASAGGWAFLLAMVQRCSLLLFLPLPAVALLVPLALLGWAGVRGATGERIALLLLGYAAGFMLVGRPDNFYWGILIAPLLPIGLAFAPRALLDLFGRIGIVNRTRLKVAG